MYTEEKTAINDIISELKEKVYYMTMSERVKVLSIILEYESFEWLTPNELDHLGALIQNNMKA
jgi:hypothetical protein